MKKDSQSQLSPQIETQYLQACEEMSALLARRGIHKKPYQDKSLSRLKSHRNPQRAADIWIDYVQMMLEAERAGDDLHDNKVLLWRALKRMNYTPLSDVFDLITNDQTLEIYTKDNWQIFRNLRFFEFVSISLDEMATFHWDRDSKRSTKLALLALATMAKYHLGLIKHTFDCTKWPVHIVRELLGEKWLVEIRLQFGSPLKPNGPAKGQPIALLIANHSRVLSTDPPKGSEQSV